jgi:DNA helicase-2/ATP-dependent DNA helicase PcrA
MSITEGLNPEQKKAVLSKSRRLLILAGAGSGKTQVLTRRITHLLANGVNTSDFLSVTFTNKAAKEMKVRIGGLLGDDVYLDDMWMGTFHGLCNRMLRVNINSIDIAQGYQIIDGDDMKKLIKQILQSEKLFESFPTKEKTNLMKKAQQSAMSYIGNKKDEGKRPESCKFTQEEFSLHGFNALTIYKKYEIELKKLNLLDFGDLILSTVEMLEDHPEILKKYQSQFKHILVDEFQDTNFIQYKWLKMLSKKSNLFVVGDDDQAIYEWRGANIKNILNFEKAYKNVEVIKLEQNYRSTNNILQCANGLINSNQIRKGKSLWSDKNLGEKIEISGHFNPYVEAEHIARSIQQKIKSGSSASDFCILYRSNAVSRVIEAKLNELKLPYRIIGGLGFWSRMEIKDVMAYLSIMDNPSNYIAIDRVINVPKRGIGGKTVEKIKDFSISNDMLILDAMESMIENKVLKGKVADELTDFLSIVKGNDNYKFTLEEKIKHIIESSGMVEYYKNENEEKGSDRLENLFELINAAAHFKNPDASINDIDAFIQHSALQTDIEKDEGQEAIQLMTIHAAKGLEFPNVYLVGIEEGIFPSSRSVNDDKLEEERRLMYVAITRAEVFLSVSYSKSRYGGDMIEPSRFINEMPEENIKFIKTGNTSSNGFTNKPGKFASFNSNSNTGVKNSKISDFKVGSQYFHKKFNQGTIERIDKSNIGKTILTVNFSKYGIKNIIII